MKIVFIGTVLFSKEILLKLISLDAEIVGILTKESTTYNSDFYDLKSIGIDNNIDTKYIKNINDKENIEWIKAKKPDVIFCMGLSQIIKEDILQIAKHGVVGYHPTALPKNRGRHPIIWALVLGLKKTASTFFIMDEGADTGDILSQKSIRIAKKDDAKALYSKVISTAKEQIEVFLPKLINNDYTLNKQDNSKSNYWRKRGRNDGEINFKMSAKSIYNLVRALSKPYVGAHLNYKEKEIKIWKVSILKSKKKKNIEFGKVLKIEDRKIYVKAYDNIICIEEHDFIILPKIGEYI